MSRAVVSVLFLVAVAVGAGYLAGSCGGRQSLALAQNTHRIAVAAPQRAAAERATLAALERSAAAKLHRDSAKARVVVVSDTTVRVDTTVVAVPMPIVSLLRADDRQIRMDSLTITAQRLEIAALREERDAWRERAQLLGDGWCGKRCHFALGVMATAGAVVVLSQVNHATR